MRLVALCILTPLQPSTAPPPPQECAYVAGSCVGVFSGDDGNGIAPVTAAGDGLNGGPAGTVERCGWLAHASLVLWWVFRGEIFSVSRLRVIRPGIRKEWMGGWARGLNLGPFW